MKGKAERGAVSCLTSLTIAITVVVAIVSAAKIKEYTIPGNCWEHALWQLLYQEHKWVISSSQQRFEVIISLTLQTVWSLESLITCPVLNRGRCKIPAETIFQVTCSDYTASPRADMSNNTSSSLPDAPFIRTEREGFTPSMSVAPLPTLPHTRSLYPTHLFIAAGLTKFSFLCPSPCGDRI